MRKIHLLKNQVVTLTGRFIEIAYVKHTNRYTALIKPVYWNGVKVTDHAWITFGDALKEIELDKLDDIIFDAEIEEYLKSGGIIDYGFTSMKNVKVIKRGKSYDYLNMIKTFSFNIVEEQHIKIYGGSSIRVVQDFTKSLDKGTKLQSGDTITCNFYRVSKDRLEFTLRTTSMPEDKYISKIYFNPMKCHQSLSVRGYFNIYLPPEIYVMLKRAYFKIFCTKTQLMVS